jgi:membrane-associated phospholipid phosphatase
LLSNVLEAGIVFTAKSVVAKERPDGSGFDSFPSGHTSTAFVAAEFLHREYGGRSVWISAGGYGMAVLMGVSRVYNGRHRVSDVVAGAGIGILSARVVYMVYPYLRKTLSRKGGSHGASVFPAYVDGCLSLNLLYGF